MNGVFTEAEIVKGMGRFSYGKGIERTLPLLVDTMARGLLEIGYGYRTGGALTSALIDMGLITPKHHTITSAGRKFLYYCYCQSSVTYITKDAKDATP